MQQRHRVWANMQMRVAARFFAGFFDKLHLIRCVNVNYDMLFSDYKDPQASIVLINYGNLFSRINPKYL